MKMNPKDIMRMTREEAFDALATHVPRMRCPELPRTCAVEALGYNDEGDAHIHIHDGANECIVCMSIPVKMAEAIRQDDDEELQSRAVEYLTTVLSADWN